MVDPKVAANYGDRKRTPSHRAAIPATQAEVGMPTSQLPVKIDLMDLDAFVADREMELMDHLRAEAPVHWNEPSANGPGFWALTRYDDVRDAAAHVGGADRSPFQ